MACYRSLSQIDYIQHKSKIKKNKKGKKAKLETTNVIIRPSSKSKKLPKVISIYLLNVMNISKNLWKDL